jgi:dTDP-4-dehydrorhamnose reductase
MKVLITGAGGQLGRCLSYALSQHQMVALDRQSLDITGLRGVRSAIEYHRPQVVINASAFNAVDGAETQVEEAYAINALGPRNLAVATAALGIAVLHVSSDYVFNGRAGRPYHEFDRTDPISAYGASKLAGEEAVRGLNPRHYIVRTAWLFWEHGRNFMQQMRARAAGTEVRVVDDQFGSPTYVPHLAEGIGRLILSEAYGTYHLAGRGGTSRWALVDEFFRLLGLAAAPIRVPSSAFVTAAARPPFSVLATIQDPRIELPPWQEGVAEFAHRVARSLAAQ